MPQNKQVKRNTWKFLSVLVASNFFLFISPSSLALLGAPASQRDGPVISKAQSAEEKGNFAEAVRQYQAFLKISPSSIEARLGLGRSLANLADCEEAGKALRGIAGSNRQRAEAETIVGNCYLGTHNYQSAIPHLHHAAILDSRNRRAWILLSHCYANTSRRPKAIEILKECLARNGDDPEVLFWIGKYYDDLSADTFQQMARNHPNSYLVYLTQGEQYLDKKDTAQARKALDRAVALAPHAPGVHYALGNLYWRLRDLDQAKRELKTELQSNPYHAMANYLMGDIYVTLGDFKEGAPYLRRAIALNPNIWDAHRALGRAWVMEKRFDEAIREFQIVANANPDDDTIHGLLSNAYRRLGNMQKAKEEGQLYLKLNRERRQRIQPVLPHGNQ